MGLYTSADTHLGGRGIYLIEVPHDLLHTEKVYTTFLLPFVPKGDRSVRFPTPLSFECGILVIAERVELLVGQGLHTNDTGHWTGQMTLHKRVWWGLKKNLGYMWYMGYKGHMTYKAYKR